MQDAKFAKRKLTTVNFPILGANVSASTQQVNLELKNFEQNGTLARLWIRIAGNIVIAGAGAGAATGRDNPEALLVNTTITTTPDLGVNVVNNVSARGLIRQALFERGYLKKSPAVADVAGTIAIDSMLPINFKKASSIKPVEYSLPMAFFSSIQLQMTFGSRDQLFSGGTNTWDLSGLRIEIWAEYDRNVAGVFHMTCFEERSFPAITASQTDFQLQNITPGFVYTDMLWRTERNLALVNDILNSLTVQGGGRVWLPQGDINALWIQQMNRENLVDPAYDPTGLYYLNALIDGYLTNALDSLDSQLDLKADVTSGAGSQFIILTSKRCKPNALQVNPIAATAAVVA